MLSDARRTEIQQEAELKARVLEGGALRDEALRLTFAQADASGADEKETLKIQVKEYILEMGRRLQVSL